MNNSVSYFISFFLIIEFYFVCDASCSDSKPPNIIFILADDLGWDDVGFRGSEIRTPNIDRLANEGVILNNYYVQPVCTPTRSAILTGKYPIHTGLQHGTIEGAEAYGMPLNLTTLPQHLKKEFGYETHAVGKWHLGFFSDAYIPVNRGFDSFLGYYNGHEDYFDHRVNISGFEGYDFHYKQQPLLNYSEVYSTDIFTDHTLSLIKNHNKSSPLFIYLAHQAVHAGNYDKIQSPQKYINRFGYITDLPRKYFAGAVAGIDDSMGAIYQALVDAGMADNTVIVFSTDNGGPTNGREQNAACNWPLRGSKATLWQGGVHVVGFVHSPLLVTKGYVNTNLIHGSDWLPSLLSLAARRSSMKNSDLSRLFQDIDGIDQWDVLSLNKTTERNEVLLNIDPVIHHEAIIVGDFKLIRGEILNGRYDGWYPPPAHKKPAMRSFRGSKCSNLSCQGQRKKPRKTRISESLIFDSGKMSKTSKDEDIRRKIDKMTTSDKPGGPALLFSYENDQQRPELSKTRSHSDLRTVVKVNCGPKPANASTNCNLRKAACLFNIRDDPCEYMNLAHLMPDLAKKLSQRLDFYRQSMVKPLTAPVDPKGNPALHGHVWQPWR